MMPPNRVLCSASKNKVCAGATAIADDETSKQSTSKSLASSAIASKKPTKQKSSCNTAASSKSKKKGHSKKKSTGANVVAAAAPPLPSMSSLSMRPKKKSTDTAKQTQCCIYNPEIVDLTNDFPPVASKDSTTTATPAIANK
ncbi:hypothetical protein ACA910_012913 [Epithemia clementina (nom. ined.)]